ncbi:hypothetical protein FEM48_Zijuj11G0072900 [Ziziphus jujuba var. spinosa]|uniref:Uncharacterized protein n=1 Tax=Ziziphus jujuba var. spinosa TaxID=714518 RepID=A0A978UHK9_ZIZJJ|nr:hypothetical protein FEM48_Zijuj11G0072900 [Ziziphus jujuba var. spinosa]
MSLIRETKTAYVKAEDGGGSRGKKHYRRRGTCKWESKEKRGGANEYQSRRGEEEKRPGMNVHHPLWPMPEVVDIGDPMTKVMVGTVENRLFKPLNEVMRRQLDPIWHSLGKKTNSLFPTWKTPGGNSWITLSGKMQLLKRVCKGKRLSDCLPHLVG